MYNYRVHEIRRVVDGDTLDAVLDLGFHLTATLRFRLLAVDTPERGQPGWAECTRYATDWLTTHAGALRAETYKADSFGRWLAHIYTTDQTASLSEDLNTYMREHSYG